MKNICSQSKIEQGIHDSPEHGKSKIPCGADAAGNFQLVKTFLRDFFAGFNRRAF